jgi:large repetitive protein
MNYISKSLQLLTVFFLFASKSANAQITITESVTGNLCAGKSKTLTTSASFGTSPYTYSWSPAGGLNVANTSVVIASPTVNTVYTLIATDASNATASTTIAINLHPNLNATFNKTDLSCQGLNNGSFNINASGGTTPYNYTFSPSGVGFFWPGIPDSITFIAVGNYTATVTDANGCSISSTTSISQPSPISATVAPKAVECFGQSNGGGIVTATGGTPYTNPAGDPYNYFWYTPSFTPVAYEKNVNTLAAGTYHVYVTDSNNCNMFPNLFEIVVVTNPTRVNSWPSVTTPVSCNGQSNAVVTVAGSGGTIGTGYTFKMNAGSFSTSNVFNGLAAGVNTFTVRDGNLCTRDSVFTITQPALLNASSTIVTPINCFGTTGVANVTATGGTMPYTGTGNVSSVGGNNNFTVADSRGCVANTSLVFSTAPAISLSVALVHPTCNGGVGAIMPTASGGTGSISILINNAIVATSYAANTYTVLATDANNCTTSTLVTLTEPSVLSVSSTSSSILCNGGSSTITASTSGGTMPVAYLINGNAVANPYIAGTYTLQATDANNCTTSTNLTITEPNLLSLNVGHTPILCNGGTSIVSANANGGAGGFTYLINGSAIANTYLAGNYTIIATDINNCSVATTINISEPATLSLIETHINPLCNGGMGSITPTVTGGAGIISILINGAVPTLNYSANIYTILATDANNCSTSTLVTLTEPNVLTITNSYSTILCNSGTAVVTPSVTGGTIPISYLINSNVVSNPYAAGTYTILATDINNCTVTTVFNISEPIAISLNVSNTSIPCNGGTSVITATATGGTLPLNYLVNGLAITNPYSAGSYIITAMDANNCSVSTIVNVTEPLPLLISSNNTNILCNSGYSIITPNAIGGAPGFTYTINGNPISNPYNAGSYTVGVIDANNCTAITNINLTEPTAVMLTATSTNAPCANANGTISFGAIGGAGTFSYMINGSNATSPYITNQLGTFTIVATDANMCSASTTVMLTNNYVNPTILSVSGVASVLCNGGSNASFNIVATNGSSPYSYALSNGMTNSNGVFSTLTANVYTVTVTESNGCSVTTMVNISEPTPLVFGITSSSIINYCQPNTGTISTIVNGGTGAIIYAIDPTLSQTSGGEFAGASTTTYTITATDLNGCTSVTNITPTATPTISITTNVVNPSCSNQVGSAMSTATGGTGSFTYSISPNSTMMSPGNFISLVGGTYTVTVTDMAGCSGVTTFNLTVPAAIVINPPVVQQPTCNGKSDGALTVSANNGTGMKTFTITPTKPQPVSGSFITLNSGIYIVKATDANGCTKTRVVPVLQPSVITFTSVSKTNPNCFGATNGAISTAAVGGVGVKTLTTMPMLPVSALSATGAASGVYTLTAKDANNCTRTTVVALTQPAVIAFYNVVKVNATSGNNGAIVVSANGGTGTKIYALLPSGTQTSAGSFSGLNNGNYLVTATDANGCSISTAVTLTPAAIVSSISNKNNISVYPNPFVSEFNLSIHAADPLTETILITNLNGEVVKKSTIELVPGTNTYSINIAEQASGIYFIKLISTAQQFAIQKL